jgi:hypothetical protein
MKQAWPVLFLVIAGLGLAWWWFGRANPQDAALRSRELATRGLADHLVSRHAGQRALIVSNPYTQRPGLPPGVYAQEQAGIRGLVQGLTNTIPVEAIVYPELKPEAREDPRAVEIDAPTTTPLSYLVAEGSFDALAQAHPGCELIVSLIGLPADVTRLRVWQRTSPVQFALLFPDFRVLGDAAAVRAAVKSGKLAAFVLPKPNAPPDQTPIGRDGKAEFDRRFLLITPDNIDQMIERYPGLFG